MSNSNMDILKQRLASGEIDVYEYKLIVKELEEKEHSQQQYSNESIRKNLVVMLDNELKVYEDGMDYKGRFFPLSKVTSVKSGTRSDTLNFVITSRVTGLSISFTDMETIYISENRAWFKSDRHKAIASAGHKIKQITFRNRVNNFVDKLIKNESVQVYSPFSKREEAVFLHSNGTLRTPTKSVDLKTAQNTGTLIIGTKTESNFSNSRSSDSSEVAISETPCGRNGKIPGNAIIFFPSLDDTDVVHGVIEWMSHEGNNF